MMQKAIEHRSHPVSGMAIPQQFSPEECNHCFSKISANGNTVNKVNNFSVVL